MLKILSTSALIAISSFAAQAQTISTYGQQPPSTTPSPAHRAKITADQEALVAAFMRYQGSINQLDNALENLARATPSMPPEERELTNTIIQRMNTGVQTSPITQRLHAFLEDPSNTTDSPVDQHNAQRERFAPPQAPTPRAMPQPRTRAQPDTQPRHSPRVAHAPEHSIAGTACQPPIDRAACEVQVVGIYEGYTQTGDTIHGDRADVVVDRPGKNVALILSSYNPVRWNVRASPTTTLDVIVTTGHGSERSEVLVNDEKVDTINSPDLAIGHQDQGSSFREGITSITKAFQTDRIDGFVGTYNAEADQALILDSADADNPSLSTNPLQGIEQVDPASLPESFQQALGILPKRSQSSVASTTFGDQGFSITSHDGTTTTLPVSLDVPEISWPSNGEAYDPRRNRVYGASSGGEGYIFVGDLGDQSLRVLRSADNLDIRNLVYDTQGDRLVMNLINHRDGVAFATMAIPDGAFETFDLDPTTFPGLLDRYDLGNGPGPAFDILAVDGDTLLVRATHAHGMPPHQEATDAVHYTVDLGTKAVQRIQ